MAIFGYGRVSSTGQHSEDQRLALERAGYDVAFWFADDGVGSTVPAARRPQLQGVLRRLGMGDALVVCTLDCLGRDAQDVVAVVKSLALRCIEVVVLQLGPSNLAGPAGRAMLAALSAAADMERQTQVQPARSGVPAPMPAKPEGRTRGRPICTTQHQRALIIQRHQAGESISALARAENLSRASVMRIVRTTGLQ